MRSVLFVNQTKDGKDIKEVERGLQGLVDFKMKVVERGCTIASRTSF